MFAIFTLLHNWQQKNRLGYIVVKDVPADCVVVGNPARIIFDK
jgi:hypothetical protein